MAATLSPRLRHHLDGVYGRLSKRVGRLHPFLHQRKTALASFWVNAGASNPNGLGVIRY
jgi:hypothetical protein